MLPHQPLLWSRLALWKEGNYRALVKGVEESVLANGWDASANNAFNVESSVRKFDSMVKSGKLRPAIRTVTDRDIGDLYKPYDRDTRTK